MSSRTGVETWTLCHCVLHPQTEEESQRGLWQTDSLNSSSPRHCQESHARKKQDTIQRAYTALDMGALYPSLAPLPLSVSDNAARHKEKTYGRVLKTRVSEVWRQTVLRDSPRVTDGSPPQGRMHTTFYRIRTQDQNIIPTQEPRPNGVPQTQYGDRRCPLCPRRHLGSEAHLYLSCTVTSPLAHPLISELRVRFPWEMH